MCGMCNKWHILDRPIHKDFMVLLQYYLYSSRIDVYTTGLAFCLYMILLSPDFQWGQARPRSRFFVYKKNASTVLLSFDEYDDEP
jgi:hypothetical protein